jgi:choline dehydrogenase-like flavoprotein
MYKSSGVSQGKDLNSGNILGFSEATAGSYDGIRQWAGGNYKFGPNVTLWTETHVSRILSQGSRATGIEYVRPVTATSGSVTAKKEVIVSSGAQGSPKLLLLRSVTHPRFI